MRTKCNNLHIVKLPAFIVFKVGGAHELHHGRHTAHDVAAFARDAATTPVEVLGPKDFPVRVVDKGNPWFVDFYAPVSGISIHNIIVMYFKRKVIVSR
jgi:DnaJ family protein C protein 10